MHAPVEIISYSREYREDFFRLNRAWLDKYFELEPIDEQVLSKPEESIIKPGGEILLAKYRGQIVGTVALIAQPNGQYELSKMAVDEEFQGLGIGKRLAQAAIECFKKRPMQTLYLESNRKLKPAISLYRKLGFVEIEHPQGRSHYQRADIYMVYQPDQR